MGVENLDKVFKPRSVAVVGASELVGSVGRSIFGNMVLAGFPGELYPVNPKYNSVFGRFCYPSLCAIGEPVDLVLVATPAAAVPNLMDECDAIGVGGVVIVSAGFSETGPEGNRLEKEVDAKRRAYGFRIIGPNSLGVMRPSGRLNGTFAAKMVPPGNVAFISQSGAVGSSMIDTSIESHVGFSHFVSLGSMLDVDFGDLIDYFGGDPETRSIIIYMESLKEARKFMSAARGFARSKPIILLKAGRFVGSAQAATLHSGGIGGEDAVYEAAFKRAGVVRVRGVQELYNCAQALALQDVPDGPNLAIVTNAGGPGVTAADTLIEMGGELAQLEKDTMRKLDEALPHMWSHSNPVDVLGDAQADRLAAAFNLCLKDRHADGVLAVYSAYGVSDPAEAARRVIEAMKDVSKPVLTCWMGQEEVRAARALLLSAGVPTFLTPEEAAATFTYLYQYGRRLALLYETPRDVEMTVPGNARDRGIGILRKAVVSNRRKLLPEEANELLSLHGITTPIHVRGGFLADALKLHLEMTKDRVFGCIIRLGLSKQNPAKDCVNGVALPPLNQVLARRLMEDAGVLDILRETVGETAGGMERFEEVMVRFSQFIVEFPELWSVVIDPLAVTTSDVALVGVVDIEIDPDAMFREVPSHEHLVIGPYPSRMSWQFLMKNGVGATIRSIRPEDEPLMDELFHAFSEETIKQRFFQLLRYIPHEVYVRYCNIDYDREVALVAEAAESGRKRLLGIGRLVPDFTQRKAEFSVVVGDPWQSMGLGKRILASLIEVAQKRSIEVVYGFILPENERIIGLCESLGFDIQLGPERIREAVLHLGR